MRAPHIAGTLGFALALVPSVAQATWPNDISLSGMDRHDGAVITEPLTDDYVQLVRELGAGMSSFPALPANTTGLDGFDVALGSNFWFTNSYDDEPTPWMRAHPDEKPESFQFSPSLIARKGLPLSLEIGGGMSWFGGSTQGAVHAFGRLAIIEGHLPWPELAVHVGYTGYIGNDELEIGVTDFGVTLGTTAPLSRWLGVTQSFLSPYIDVSLLRMKAVAVVDDDIYDRVGFVKIGGADADQAALTGVRVAGGLQVASGPAIVRVNVAWTAGTPLLLGMSTGIGF